MRFLADAGEVGTAHEVKGRVVLEVLQSSIVLEPEQFAAFARMVRDARRAMLGLPPTKRSHSLEVLEP